MIDIKKYVLCEGLNKFLFCLTIITYLAACRLKINVLMDKKVLLCIFPVISSWIE